MGTNVDRPFGFQVYGELLRTNLYVVTTAPVINVFHNDIIIAEGNFLSTPYGYMTTIADAAIPASAAPALGSVVSVFDENMYPVKYIAATRVGAGGVAGYVLIADHPMQLFLAQEDADGNAIDLADGSMNADIIATTLALGNTASGISKMEIDSDSAGNGAALMVKLVHPYMYDLPATDTDVGCRYIVQINEHYYGDTIAGIA